MRTASEWLVKIGSLAWLVGVAAVVVLAIFVAFAYRRQWHWTGFAGGEDRPAKTLWDWLQLLLIPLAVAGLVFFLNRSQSDREQTREDQRAARERRAADDATREAAWRAYLTQMTGLMLDRRLLRAPPEADVHKIARTLTLTVLRRLDGERKALVVRFLLETTLLDRGNPAVINMQDANLEYVHLSGAYVKYAPFDGVDLKHASLDHAGFANTSFVDADLRGADLSHTSLGQIDLSEADLRGASLRGADLDSARLGGARLSGADLRGATLNGADLTDPAYGRATYDSATKWPDGYDPVAAGAMRLH